jgi:hypothetical protein
LAASNMLGVDIFRDLLRKEVSEMSASGAALGQLRLNHILTLLPSLASTNDIVIRNASADDRLQNSTFLCLCPC